MSFGYRVYNCIYTSTEFRNPYDSSAAPTCPIRPIGGKTALKADHSPWWQHEGDLTPSREDEETKSYNGVPPGVPLALPTLLSPVVCRETDTESSLTRVDEPGVPARCLTSADVEHIARGLVAAKVIPGSLRRFHHEQRGRLKGVYSPWNVQRGTFRFLSTNPAGEWIQHDAR